MKNMIAEGKDSDKNAANKPKQDVQQNQLLKVHSGIDSDTKSQKFKSSEQNQQI